jgi:hypothetical protein
VGRSDARRFRRIGLACLGLAAACTVIGVASSRGAMPQRPALDRTLRVLAANPRYFTDGSGRAVYLTGSHVWWNLAADETWDFCLRNPAAPFDYDVYLDELARHGHNFFRLWATELIRWNSCGRIVSVDLHPWARTGGGLAVDGKPRFDLQRFNPAYFSRLRERVQKAQRRGFYVSVMLFEGWAVQFEEDGWGWRGHPFNPLNNANGVDVDVNGDGRALEVHTLADPRAVQIQEAYVRKVIDTVNRFDNVLYEIANESGIHSTAWQYRMIDLVKRYERRKPKRHPVGMTYQHGGDYEGKRLYASRADWISPYIAGPQSLVDPLRADGRKVILLDTDHLCGVCGDAAFVWKAFLRGHNPIYMDPLDRHPVREAARRAMGQTRHYAGLIGLRTARPRGDLTSTRFALAVPRRRYLAYQPQSGSFLIRFASRARVYHGHWFDPASRRTIPFRGRRLSGTVRLAPPWNGPAVVYLRAR